MAFNNCERNGCNSSFPTEWNCGRDCRGTTNHCNDFENDNMNCSCRCRWCQERQDQNAREERKECRGRFEECNEDKDYGKNKYDYDRNCGNHKCECDKKHDKKEYDCDNKHDWDDSDDCGRGKKECRRGCFFIRFC